MMRRLPCSCVTRVAPGTWLAGIDRLNIADRSAIDTTKAQTLPGEIVSGTVEIIMHFKSTASFAHHGSAPSVECEMTRLVIEPSSYQWTKHEHCHARVSNQVIDNSTTFARRTAAVPYRRNGQVVPLHRRSVTRLHGKRMNDATRSLQGKCPNEAYEAIARERHPHGGPLP
jgi:hypothetical protein